MLIRTRGDPIYQYDLTLGKQNNLVFTFCDGYTGAYQWEIEHSGATNWVCNTSDGPIFYAACYPYVLRKYTSDGVLQFELTRNVAFFKPPHVKNRAASLIRPLGHANGIGELYEGVLIVSLLGVDERENRFKMCFDFWDSAKDEFLGTFDVEALGIRPSPAIVRNDREFLYVYSHNLYPHIVKHRVHLARK